MMPRIRHISATPRLGGRLYNANRTKCPQPRRVSMTGCKFLGKTALNATLHGSDVISERDTTRQPRHGCHASRVRSSVVCYLVADCQDIHAFPRPLSSESPLPIEVA